MRHFRLLVPVLALVAVARALVVPSPSAIDRINHIVVIYQENWSFDGLFGKFPGANGLVNAGATVKQADKDGRPYVTLPPSIDNRKRPPSADPRIPAGLPVAPFNLGLYVKAEDTAGNPVHRFYQQQYQINAGTMDRFIPWSGVTPDGYVVNTAYTVNVPHPEGTAPSSLLPNLTQPTIGDRLDEKGISWAWYSGGWRDALAGRPHPNFQFHHQPFAYFANWADGTAAKAQHLKDEDEFRRDLERGTLPTVSFVKPLGPDNEHPGYASLLKGQEHVAALVRAIMMNRAWEQTAIIITYDENGGRWDHVSPPRVDRWGPGMRVPTLVISPFSKRRYVDHTYYDTTSIMKLIERRWGLAPLGLRDAAANDLSNAFDSRAAR